MTRFARDFVDSIEGHSVDISTKELSGVRYFLRICKTLVWNNQYLLFLGRQDILYFQ